MKILLCTDGSATGTHAIREAMRLLPLHDAELSLMHVCQPLNNLTGYHGLTPAAPLYPPSDALERGEALLAEGGLKAILVEKKGFPVDEILEEARKWKPDLLVLGSHGDGFWERLLIGSISDDVLHHWQGAVLIVRPQPSRVGGMVEEKAAQP